MITTTTTRYIPSDPPSRATSKLSSSSRQNSVEEGSCTLATPPPSTSTRGDQTYRPGAGQDRSNGRAGGRYFGHQYPSRQASQGSPPPPSRSQGMQTGSSLLRMFLKKVKHQLLCILPLFLFLHQADKGNQVREQPQAFFLPLEEGEPGSSSVIDLEAAGGVSSSVSSRSARSRRRSVRSSSRESSSSISSSSESHSSDSNINDSNSSDQQQ